MTNPLEQAPQQVEFLPPVDQDLLNKEASLVLRDYFQPDVDGIAEEIRKTPEPSLGYWEPCVRAYANSGRAPDLDRPVYEEEARKKAPEERNAFDKFVLGVGMSPPEDVQAPEGSHLTTYGYYKDTGKRLRAAIEEGKVPEGFEDPALLEKATDFLLARGVNQLFAQPDRANVDLDTALTVYRQATEHIPGFNSQNAGSNLLVRTGIASRAILKAESPHFAQNRSAGREQAAQILQIASEVEAINHIRGNTTLTEMYERQAALDQELGLQESLDQKAQHNAEPKESTEAWPTEEQGTDEPGAYPEVITSLKATAPEKETTDNSTTTSPEAPVQPHQDTSTEQARQSVDEAFDGPQMVFEDTAGIEWERQPHNTVVRPNGPQPIWHTSPASSGEVEHVLVPADIRVEQRPSTGWPEGFEREPQIGDSKIDQFLTRVGQGLRRWSRANATHGSDARLKNKVGNAFSALGGLAKSKAGPSSTAAEMDARDAAEYAHIDAATAEGHTVSYDANGDAVVGTEPRPAKQTWRERRRARQQPRLAVEGQPAPQPEQRPQPQTAEDSRLEQLRQEMADRNARINRLDDHIAHNEQSLAIQEINNLPAEALQLPYATMINLEGAVREAWEVRLINETSRPGRRIPPPPPELIRTDAGRRAYEQRFPNRRTKLPWQK